MSQLPTATPLPFDDDIEPTPHAEVVLETPASLAEVKEKPAPTLITEQEVLMGTAAALAPPSTRWWMRAVRVFAAPARVFATTEPDSRPKPRHYPPRLDFMEDSRMAREMLRGF
ncbi:hypothetical protein MNVI_32980 [Mycobacterium noviomagense]|uniref:Uncharacterized protein n=1 Tax=Mycobacterium noviomagense TaxID=459858 RepID=A0A7I7PHI5_9MYCO|nr:hypothetical protein BST37_19970 [Mycobacterium noviomagense]BBY07980.1 hypothetical protein MNVI_32980 [Mycobacterium noviomagense]